MKPKLNPPPPPECFAARSFNGSESFTFSCRAHTINQIEKWASDAHLIMFGASSSRSDVLAIMTATLVACDWKPGKTVELTILPPSPKK